MLYSYKELSNDIILFTMHRAMKGGVVTPGWLRTCPRSWAVGRKLGLHMADYLRKWKSLGFFCMSLRHRSGHLHTQTLRNGLSPWPCRGPEERKFAVSPYQVWVKGGGQVDRGYREGLLEESGGAVTRQVLPPPFPSQSRRAVKGPSLWHCSFPHWSTMGGTWWQHRV